MRVCLQRVSRAQVSVEGEICGQIERGLLVLLGVVQGDREADARQLAQKIVSLRVFDDVQGKMNLSVGEVGGAVLVVSQFTLAGDCRKGRRPSFDAAAGPSWPSSFTRFSCRPLPSKASPWPPAAFAPT